MRVKNGVTKPVLERALEYWRNVDKGIGDRIAKAVLKLPRVSYPAKASAATRDAKCLDAGRERPQGLSRPFSSRRMWSVSAVGLVFF
jgi:hypothetical protein